MNYLLPTNTHPEFHFFQRFTFDWHLVFYSHDEESSFASRSEAAYTRREGQARDFMTRLQRRLGLKQKELLFFGVTEFGDTQKGHLHLLLSFDGLREKGALGKIAASNSFMRTAVNSTNEEMFRSRLKIGCQPVGSSEDDQARILSYVCKKEYGHGFKHCFFSRYLPKKNSANAA